MPVLGPQVACYRIRTTRLLAGPPFRLRALSGDGHGRAAGTVGFMTPPDSGEREGRCPTEDEAERFEHIDSLAPFCTKCCRHHGYVPPHPPASFTTIPWHLAHRILAALEHDALYTRERLRDLASELRAAVERKP